MNVMCSSETMDECGKCTEAPLHKIDSHYVINYHRFKQTVKTGTSGTSVKSTQLDSHMLGI